MRIYYTVYHALTELKRQIKVIEKELKIEESDIRRLTLLSSAEWLFERGISLIENTKPKDKADLLDFFQDKSQLRKDVIEEKKMLEEIFFNKE